MENEKREKYINIAIIVLLITAFILGVKIVSGEQNEKDIEISMPKINFDSSKFPISDFKTADKQSKKIDKQSKVSYSQNIKPDIKIVFDLNSENEKTRKSIFNEMLKVYQNAFCIGEAKTVQLPNDLFETLSISLPKSGSSDIEIDGFIKINYMDVDSNQKEAIRQTLEGLNEISEEIRMWDISKSLISYAILKSNKVELNKSNLKKAQNCINGKMYFQDIENDFYRQFGISKKNTHKILISLCEEDWIKAQTEFAEKFLATSEKIKKQVELKRAAAESDFKYPQNVNKSIILENKGEKLHVVSVYEASNSIGCINENECNRRGNVIVKVTDKSAPVNLLLASYESVLWDVRAAEGVKINKIYVGSYYKDKVKAPKGTLVYNIPEINYLEEGEHFIVESKLEKKVLTFQYEYEGTEFVVDSIKGKIAPAKNINIKSKVISDLASNDFKTKKALFNEMLRVYQNAFCIGEAKTAKLPNDLFEKLAVNLPDSGPEDISIDKFILLNYMGIASNQKAAIKQTLEGMKEVSGIRMWDISKSLISYGILKSSNIELTQENLQKAQECINGKGRFDEIEKDFYVEFGINPQNTHEILTLLCNNDWMRAQTEFAAKFLEK